MNPDPSDENPARLRIARFSKRSVALVRRQPPRPSLAENPRSLPHLGFRNHAATNPRGRRTRPLSSLPEALPKCPSVGGSVRKLSTRRMEWPRLLPSRPNDARMRSEHRRRTSLPFSAIFQRASDLTRNRPLHRRRHRQHRFRRTNCSSGRQRRTSTAAPSRQESHHERSLAARTVLTKRISPRRFQSVHDETRRIGVYSAATEMQSVPHPKVVHNARRSLAYNFPAKSVQKRNLVCSRSTQARYPPSTTSG